MKSTAGSTDGNLKRAALGLLTPLVLCALAGMLAVGYWRFSYDDAFITYRYATNLVATGALEFNVGERVLGTSAPGWALILAVLTRLSPAELDVAAWGTLLSLGALVAMALALASALRAAQPLVRLGLPLLVGVVSLTLQWNLEMLGAETMAVTALVPWGVLSALRGRPVLGGFLLAAAACCRLDAGLAGGLLVLVQMLRDRGAALRTTVAFSLTVLFYLGVVALYFGAIVPNTLGAKQSEMTAALPSYSVQEWSWLRRSLPASGAAAGALGLAAVGLGMTVARLRAMRAPSQEVLAGAILGAWLVGHELAYRLLGVPFAPWYQVPTVNAMVVLAGSGALLLGDRIARNVPSRVRVGVAFGLATLLLLAVFRPGAFVLASWHRPPDPRFLAFRTLGEHLAGSASVGTTAAALEIGVIGVFAPEQRVLDLGGLVSPEVLAARRAGRLPDLVTSRRPEYLVHSTLFPEVFDPILAQVAGSYGEELRLPDGRGYELILLRRRTPRS
jgi:hypothetical protein